ncbi:MAG: DUF459 domain-containing protein [Deltaproteobacteria bacterium]|nr:DUF459 domain-containing protein [Deltaproteobacteria bacterium]
MRTIALALALVVTTSTAPGYAEPDVKCPKIGREPNVYGIGGSTMGSLLGPMLKTVYEEHGIGFRRWGKASTGLARPDFHDWPGEAPGIMEKHDPDIVIVSLGTNDYQPIWVSKSEWIMQDDPAWQTAYGDRVDELLEALTKDDDERLVIWSGPYAFKGENAEKRAPVVNRIMKERVEAFAKKGKRVVFHDAFTITSDDAGRPASEAVVPGKGKKPVKIRQKDGVHLTADAVRGLLAEPIVDMTLPCFKKSGEKKAAQP